MSLHPKSPLTDGRFEVAIHKFRKEIRQRLTSTALILTVPLARVVLGFVGDNPLSDALVESLGWIGLSVAHLGYTAYLRQRFMRIASSATPPLTGDYKFFLYRWGKKQPTQRLLMLGILLLMMIYAIGMLALGGYLLFLREADERMLTWLVNGIGFMAIIAMQAFLIVVFRRDWAAAQAWYQEKYG